MRRALFLRNTLVDLKLAGLYREEEIPVGGLLEGQPGFDEAWEQYLTACATGRTFLWKFLDRQWLEDFAGLILKPTVLHVKNPYRLMKLAIQALRLGFDPTLLASMKLSRYGSFYTDGDDLKIVSFLPYRTIQKIAKNLVQISPKEAPKEMWNQFLRCLKVVARFPEAYNLEANTVYCGQEGDTNPLLIQNL